MIMGANGKAGAHVAFGLITCHPSAGCSVCYAAGDRYTGVLDRGVRNTMLVLAKPEAFGRRLAEEVKTAYPDKSELPFFRLLGSGDMTSEQQVTAFNTLSQHLDRPIHIFSRHHDLLLKLKSSQNAPFVRMASVDGQLVKHYGIDALIKDRRSKGLLVAYLASSDGDLKHIDKLQKNNSLALVLTATEGLYKNMVEKLPETRGAACPCDAGLRPFNISCTQCALSRLGCFMYGQELMVDAAGNNWVAGDPAMPDAVVPALQFPSGKALARAWQNTTIGLLRKSIEGVRTQLANFFGSAREAYEAKNGKNTWQKVGFKERIRQNRLWNEAHPAAKNTEPRNIILKDLRWVGDSVATTDPLAAEVYIATLEGFIQKAEGGEFHIPGAGTIPAVTYRGGERVTGDEESAIGQSDRSAAKPDPYFDARPRDVSRFTNAAKSGREDQTLFGVRKSEQDAGEKGPVLYSVGDRLRDLNDFPSDNIEPVLLDVNQSDGKIKLKAGLILRGWEREVTAADGRTVLLHNKERGRLSNRVTHLVSDNESDVIDRGKARWMPNVPETVKNAYVVLDDADKGTKIYVRAYQDGTKHMVIVLPDGTIKDQKAFRGSLITQFPSIKPGRQGDMIVEWQRGEETASGRSPGNPDPTPRASLIPDSQRGESTSVSARLPSGVKLKRARAELVPLRRKWANGPQNFVVVQSENDPSIPEHVRREGMRGAYDPSTDTVYLVADNMDAEHGPAFVALHEVIGHRGIEAVMGLEANSLYLKMAMERRADVSAYAEENGMGFNTAQEKRQAAQEWLADRVASGDDNPSVRSWWRRILDAMKRGIARIFGKRFSDSQLEELARNAHRYTREGRTRMGGEGEVRHSISKKEPMTDSNQAQERDQWNQAKGRLTERRRAEKTHERLTGKPSPETPRPASRVVESGVSVGREQGRELQQEEDARRYRSDVEKFFRSVEVPAPDPKAKALSALGLAKKVGIEIGAAQAREVQIDKAFSEFKKLYGDDTQRLRDHYEQLDKNISGLEAVIKNSGDDPRARAAAAEKEMRFLFGADSLRSLKMTAPGEIEQVVKFLRRRLNEHLSDWFSKNAAKKIMQIDPDLLYNDHSPAGLDYGLDLADKWKRIFEPYKSLVEARKQYAQKKDYLAKNKKTMLPDEVESRERALENMKDAIHEQIHDLPWETSQKLHDDMRDIITQDRRIKKNIADGISVKRSDMVEAIGTEIAANIPEQTKVLETKTPSRRSLLKHYGVEMRGAIRNWALTLAGGNEQSVVYKVFYELILKGSSKADTMDSHYWTMLEGTKKDLGITPKMFEAWIGKDQTYEVLGYNHTFKPVQIMELYALTRNQDNYQALLRGGFKGEQYGEANDVGRFIILGETADATAEAIDQLVNTLTPQQKALIDRAIEHLAEAAAEGNRTSLEVMGYEDYTREFYWPRRVERKNAREESPEDAMSRVKGFGPAALTGLGMRKKIVEHKEPIVLGNAFNTYNDHIRQMADWTHLTVPTLDALHVLNSESVKGIMAETVGKEMRRMITRTIARTTHLAKHSDAWGKSWIARKVAKQMRNAAVSILAFRQTSKIFNRVGGSLLISNRMHAISTRIGLDFDRYTAKPAFFSPAERERISAIIFKHSGFFHQRINQDQASVYAQLPTDEDTLHTENELRQRKWSHRAMSGMGQMELSNAIAAFKAFKNAGCSDAEAVWQVEMATRETQNPSTPLEETGYNIMLKENPLAGAAFMFFGQPAVASSMLLTDLQRAGYAHKSGQGKAKAYKNVLRSIAALTASSLFTVGVRRAVSLASGGMLALFWKMMTGDDDEENKALAQQNEWDALGFVGDLTDSLTGTPGLSMFTTSLANLGKTAMSFDADTEKKGTKLLAAGGKAFEGEATPAFISAISKGYRAAQNAARYYESEDREEDWWRLEKAGLDAIETVGAWSGLPTGGPVQILKVGSGLAGHPLGKKPQEEE